MSPSQKSDPPLDTGPEGPIPEENTPGYRPAVEQDKPTGPPPRPKRAASKAAERKGAKQRATGRAAKATAAKPGKAPKATKATTAKPAGAAQSATTAKSATSAKSAAVARPAAAARPAAVATPPKALPAPAAMAAPMRFAFAFEPRVLPFAAAFGVLPFTTGVEVTEDELRIRFGLWSLSTELTNIVEAEVTGPYRLRRVAGPAHLSLADGGITFATSTRAGACIKFRTPVPAALPVPLLRHGSVTVTVAEPEALVRAIRSRIGA